MCLLSNYSFLFCIVAHFLSVYLTSISDKLSSDFQLFPLLDWLHVVFLVHRWLQGALWLLSLIKLALEDWEISVLISNVCTRQKSSITIQSYLYSNCIKTIILFLRQQDNLRVINMP